MVTKPRVSRQSRTKPPAPGWDHKTELVSIMLNLVPARDGTLYPQYTIGLHAWSLDQVRQDDPALSAYLHDGESEKPFTISGLVGKLATTGRSPKVLAGEPYTWTISALSQPVAQWLGQWVKRLPGEVALRNAPLPIHSWAIAQPPTTYQHLWDTVATTTTTIALQFLSPTSFRRQGHHFPLPVPTNVFHSYLRRWNDFSGQPIDQTAFLDWVDSTILITRHHLESVKTVAGKRGSVTGFTGAVEFSRSPKGKTNAAFTQLWLALGQLAPYCGTGHKTTFGLGQTRCGWAESDRPVAPLPTVETLVAQRVAELTEIFTLQRKRLGGDRATKIAETWATILARRELGESLQAIAADLALPYKTAKTYVKLARRAMRAEPSAFI